MSTCADCGMTRGFDCECAGSLAHAAELCQADELLDAERKKRAALVVLYRLQEHELAETRESLRFACEIALEVLERRRVGP